MRVRILSIISVLLLSVSAFAQTAAIQGFCNLGGTAAKTSGLNSTNDLQGIIPSCTVTVYLTGTQTLATIYANGNSTPLSNPFTTSALGSVAPGQWIFWAAINQGYDVVMSGGIAPNTYPQPVTLTDVFPSFSFSGSGISIQTNGTQNALQTVLNHENSTNCFWTNPSGGVEQVSCNLNGSFQTYTPPPIAGQSVLIYPTTVVSNSNGDPATCPVVSNLTSGTVRMNAAGNLGCSPPPGPSITWSNFTLPAYVVPANVTAIYAVTTAGFSGASQALHITCGQTSPPNSTYVMNGSTIGGTDTGVMKPYSAQLTWATGANIGTVSCVADMQANTGGATVPVILNVPSIGLLVYYTGTAPPVNNALNLTAPLYLNPSLNSMGVSAINLAAPGDGGVIGLLPNANLANPSMTINGTTCTLGGSCTPSGGSGTVTSVALSLPSWMTVAGSPITTSGTFTVTATVGEPANEFLATPNGTTGAVGLRAIVAADIPTLNQSTTGTAANLSGTPALPNGSTATTQTAGDNTTKLATDAFVLANSPFQSLTTIGTSGAATLTAGVLNIPNYVGGSATPGGTTGAIQYNNAGAFGGANLTGLLYGNGSTAPTAATIAQAGSAFYDVSETNYLMAPQTPTAGWPLPSGFVNNLIVGPMAAQNLGNFSPINTTATAASGSTTITFPSAVNAVLPLNIIGAGIPLGDTVTAISGGTTGTLAVATTAALSSTAIQLYPATVFSTTGTAASGSTTLTLPYAFPAQVYQVVNGAGIPTNDPISAISGTTVTLTNATTAALSGTPITITPGATNGLVAEGFDACMNCISNNGSVALGVQAMLSFIGDGTGGEDANSVAIGSYTYSGCNGYAPYTYPLFESNFVGNKVFASGCGATDSEFYGNHMYGFFNALDSSIIGGEEGINIAGVQIVMSQVQAVGDGEFNPIRSGGATPPAGTYNVSKTNIFGSVSAQSMFNTHDNNVFGTGSMDGGTYANTAIFNDVFGNSLLNFCTSCSYNLIQGGQDATTSNFTARSLTTGNLNVIQGAAAGMSLTTASGNTITGADAAMSEVTNQITAYGQGACKNATGANMVCIGPYAGSAITTGTDDFIGANGNAAGDGPTGASSFDATWGMQAGLGNSTNGITAVGFQAARRNVTSLGNITAIGYQEFFAGSGATGTEQYDLFAGDSSNCTGCTYGVSLGHAAQIGAVAHATQIDSGTNSTANTVQYQTWNFLDASGNLNAKLLVASHGASAIASAATIAPSAYITHISGTAAISTITPPTVTTNGGVFSGCIELVPDAVWTLATGGNIGKASTAIANQLMTVCYDGTTWYPSY